MSGDEFILINNAQPTPPATEKIERIDSRGDISIGSGIVLAVVKTFRSGNPNVPMILFYIPGKRS